MEQMNTQEAIKTVEGLGGEVLKRLDAVTNQMGVTAEYLWPLLVQEVKVEGLCCLFISFVILGAGGWISRKLWREHCKEIEICKENNAGCDGGFMVLSGLVVGVTTLFFLAMFICAIQRIITPEAYAIRTVLTLLGSH